MSLERAEERLDNLVALERDTAPTFSAIGEGRYRFIIPSIATTLEADHLRREGGQLKAEVLARCELPGAQTFDGVLSIGDLNLSSPRTRKSHAQYLSERARTKKDEVDWTGLMEEFGQRVLAAERNGQPAVWLHELPEPEPDKFVAVEGWELARHQATCLFGDGSAGKSLLALWALGRLALAGLRVGMADWEMDQAEHRRRLRQLFGAEMPPIRYVRCSRPFVQEAERLRRIVREDRLEYLLLDSISYATDGPAEQHEVAARYLQSLRSLGEIGSLHNAHITKALEGNDHKPFGSVFWHNSMRLTWNVKTAGVQTNDSELSVGLYNRKINTGARRQAVGFRFRFDGEAGPISVERVNVADVGDLAAQLSVPERVRIALRRGPLSRGQLSSELEDVKPDTLRTTINREKNAGRVLEFGDRLSLADRRQE